MTFHSLQPFFPPKWCKRLTTVPKSIVKLGHLNTPIHRWKLPDVPEKFEIFIKRDDMTGSTLSGNKVRKLEFLFADAIEKGCKHVITCGSIQSNFARSTAVSAAQLGLKCSLLLRSPYVDSKGQSRMLSTSELDNTVDLSISGNVLLDRMCDAKIYLVPKTDKFETELKPKMERLAKHIKNETGEESYIVPVGGSNTVGLYGYLTAFEEMIQQGLLDQYDDVVFACGSGGTAAGLAIGNYLNESKIKVHAFTVCDNKTYFTEHINDTLENVGLGGCVLAEDIIDIVDGYKGRGYGLSTPEELDFIRTVAQSTGILLDPCYSGKAAYGLMKEIKANPDRFQGNRILFIHTGGIFGLFDGKMDSFMRDSSKEEMLTYWKDLDDFSQINTI